MEGDICIPPSTMRRQLMVVNASSGARKMQPDTLAQREGGEEKQTVVSREGPGKTQGILKPSVALKLPVLGRKRGVMKLAAAVYQNIT